MRAQHVDSCTMPGPAHRTEAEIYRGIRDTIIRSHCDAGRAHRCCGSVTITRDTITLSCPLCGDTRKIITAEAE